MNDEWRDNENDDGFFSGVLLRLFDEGLLKDKRALLGSLQWKNSLVGE